MPIEQQQNPPAAFFCSGKTGCSAATWSWKGRAHRNASRHKSPGRPELQVARARGTAWWRHLWVARV